MNRRSLLTRAITTAALAPFTQTLPAMTALTQTEPSSQSDALNPPQDVRAAGIRMLPVVGGKYKVWTKKLGSGPIKVLVLHGGPGFTHSYLEALESFLPPAGIEMYYYDQLGCGNSDIPDDPSLWTLPRFTEEVEEVRQGLGLDNFILYGHSWGGILAMEYALNYQNHLSGLVISNMAAGTQAFLKRTAEVKHWLSEDKQSLLSRLEAHEAYDDPAYTRLMMEDLYPQMICRLHPWPEPVTRTFRLANLKIYEQMQGKSEFLVTGNLKDWERWDSLHRITVPTLTMGAKYDEMDPNDMVRMAELMPHATSHICQNGSHMSMWDQQQDYFSALLAFLRRPGVTVRNAVRS